VPVSIQSAPLSTAQLKRMTLDELLTQEVVLVSRRPEALGTSASAVQVISSEEIRRSGATRLPEILRLASNLQVAQIDASRWAISARGFNSVLANKLLVQIDGRSVYSPLFAGVFWDAQDVMLEDIDRIEVVSGPGGTLWGANAVNGVINVRTKSARATQGGLVTAGGGTGLRRAGAVRYGGEVGSRGHFRVYGKRTEREGSLLSGGSRTDDWRATQGGFRFDWDGPSATLLTVQGDLYENVIPGVGGDAFLRGGNLLGRWSRTLANDSAVELQVYYDRVRRDLSGSYDDRLDTYDLDFQHQVRVGERHHVVWGAGYRWMNDHFTSRRIALLPPRVTLEVYNAFLQDEIALVPDRLHLTLGAKVEHNEYTGGEFQPSARVAWTPDSRQTWWTSVSRAVRTPSRLDRDRFIPGVIAGSPNFDSEELLAWEAGWRGQPHDRLSLALVGFHHDYDGIRSIEFAPPGGPALRELRNQQTGRSYGIELSADLQVRDWWRIGAGVTEMRVEIRPEPGSADTSFGALESVDAHRHLSLRSSWNLPGNIEASAHLRHASRLTNPFSNTPAYTELDARLAWRPRPEWELSVAGQNLLHARHVEYGDPTMRHEVERTVYAMVRWEY
jgi:iron complex outermembrane recepter protein